MTDAIHWTSPNKERIKKIPGANKIVEILVNRDGMDAWDAEDLVIQTRKEILDLAARGGSLDEVEEIIADNLGLEPDYIDYLGVW